MYIRVEQKHKDADIFRKQTEIVMANGILKKFTKKILHGRSRSTLILFIKNELTFKF